MRTFPRHAHRTTHTIAIIRATCTCAATSSVHRMGCHRIASRTVSIHCRTGIAGKPCSDVKHLCDDHVTGAFLRSACSRSCAACLGLVRLALPQLPRQRYRVHLSPPACIGPIRITVNRPECTGPRDISRCGRSRLVSANIGSALRLSRGLDPAI